MAQPSPLSPAWQRAQELAGSGDLAGARAVLERAAELGKVNLSEDDPDVLQTAYLLATIHQRADDPSAARRVLEDAYAAGQRRLGDAHPLMVQISHDIGVAAEELGNRHEARKAFGRVAEFGPSVLGPQHRAVARARAYLGQDQTPSVRPEAARQPQAAPPQPPPQTQAVPLPQAPPAPPAQRGPAAEAAPSTPYDTRQQGWSPAEAPQQNWPAAQAPQSGWPAAETPRQPTPPPVAETPQQGSPAPAMPQQRPSAVEAPGPSWPVSDQATEQIRAVEDTPPERTTHMFGAIPRAPGPGLVEPPSPANQQVWPGPAPVASNTSPNPINEATVAHPVITPRPGVNDTRIRHSPGYGEAVDAGQLAAPLVVAATYRQGRPYEKRGFGLFAAIAAVLAAVIAVAALVFVLANRGDDQPSDPNVPTLGGKAPAGVRLRDEGSKIGITWQDPSAGTVSFMVAMGHPGEQLKPVATLGPGQTSYELGALNAALNYCFTVIAVYRGNQFATSAQTCTDRPGPSTSK